MTASPGPIADEAVMSPGTQAEPGVWSPSDVGDALDGGSSERREATATVGKHSRRVVVATVILLLLAELVAGWPWIVSTLESFQAPVWTWFGLALVADVASMGAYARMQRRLLHVGGTSVSLPSAAALAYASHSLSDTLPGGPAFSAVFSFRRMRQLGASAGVASWAIAFSGAISTGALVVVGAAAGLLVTGRTDTGALVAYVAVAVLLVLTVRAFNRRPGLVTRSATRAVRAINRMLRHDPRRGVVRVQRLIADITAIRIRPRDFSLVAVLAIVNWLLDALCLYLCLVAVGVDDASPAAVLLAYTAGMAALSVPIVPGGLGVVDAALVLGLVAGGTSPADAIAATILFRVITLGLIIGAGWVVWGFTRSPRETPVRSAVKGSPILPAEGQVGQRSDWLDRTPEGPEQPGTSDGVGRPSSQVT